ncbi:MULTISPECIES: alpha-(1-_6)-mannopyranosyltransferase A [unclassified Gordonia (in: high G+C Gram-positive bacteria)]
MSSKVRFDLRLGVVGSILVCLGGFGVADIPRNHPVLTNLGLSWLTYGHGKTLCGMAFWAGVAAMVIAWIRLGRALNASGCTVPVRSLRRWVLAWSAPLAVTVPLFSRDVYAYLGQGALFVTGFNPYTDGPAHRPGPLVDSMAQVWATTTAPYGPLFVTITRAVSALTGDHVILGVLAMRLVLLPGLFLSLWAIPRLATHFGASPQAGLWLVLFNPMVLIHLVGGPHVELLMMGVLVAGVTLVATGRHAAGLVVLGLAVSIKITAGIAVPFMVWIWLAHLRARRGVGARDVAGVFAAVAVIPLAVFAACTAVTGLGLGWLTGLGWADRIINWFTLPTLIGHLVTLVAAPFVALNLQPVLSVTRMVGQVVLAVILVCLWWRSRPTERAAMAGLCWAMLAVLVLEPSTLPWYYTWLLCVVVAFTLPARARAVVVAVSVFMLIVFQPDDSILFYKLPETLLALTLAGVAAWASLRPDPLRVGVLARRAWG